MAAFNFPNSPSTNDTHTENGVTYKWNGTVWKRQNASYTDATNLNVTGIGTFAGAVHIGGVLTYEDVKNVDSVGVITARSGIDCNGTLEVSSTSNFDDTIKIADKIEHLGDSNTNIRFPAADTVSFETAGSEKLRITSAGDLGLGTVPETDGQAGSLYFKNGNANIWGSSNVNLYTVVNARYTGTAWKYNNTAVASYVGQQSGVWSFHNAPSGTADASATFTERLRIDSDGRLRIGNTTQNQYTAADDLIIGSGSGDRGLTIYSGASDAGVIAFSDGTSDTAYRSGQIIYDHSTNAMDFRTNGNNIRLHIASDGEVFIGEGFGATNRSTLLSISGANQDPSGVWTQMGLYSSDSQAANKGGSIGFGGQDGSTAKQQFSAIKGAKENGTSGNYAGYLAFYTRPAGAVSNEKLRITSDGRVVVKCNGNQRGLELNIGSGAGSLVFDRNGYITSFIRASDGGSNVGGGSGGGSRMRLGKTQIHFDTFPYVTNVGDAVTYTERLKIHSSGQVEFKNGSFSNNVDCVMANGGTMEIGAQSTMKFRTATNERMRIASDGKGYFATTSQGPHGGFFNINASSSNTNGLNVQGTTANYVIVSSAGGSTGDHIYFSNWSNSNNNTGRIKDNSSNVTYYTSSDYRLKENVVSISDGITRVKQLNPVRHTWKNNPALGTVDGWIAHELDAVCPDAVDGVKDAVNEDGSIDAQAADYGRITPLLTAAIKELIAKVETLEAEVAALKSS